MQTLSVLPSNVTLQFPRGYAATINLAFTTVDNAVVDITGDTITMTVEALDGTAKATASGVITSAVGGTATVTLTAANLTDTNTGISRYQYVITRTHAGVVTPWWAGLLELHDTVTA